MKRIAIFVMVVLFVTPIASANSDWNPIEIGKKMISDGIVDAFSNMADEIMELICGTPEEGEEEEHDTVTTMIINFATWGVKPFEYPSIIQMLGVSFVVGIGVLVVYIFVGAGVSAMGNYQSNYGKNVFHGVLLLSFAPLLVWTILLTASILKIMMMEAIADSISPSVESCTVLYVMMALMWLLVAIFFGISNIVICITAGLSCVLGALYAPEKTRHVATWAFDYFVTMVAMQVMVITIAVVTVGIMMDIKTGKYGDMITPGMESITYVGMILLILIMCLFMTVGKALVLKTAKKVVSLVI